MHDLDLVLENLPRSNANILIKIGDFLCLAIIMFALPVTVCEIMTFNLSKWSVFKSVTFIIRSISCATTSPNTLFVGVLMAYNYDGEW